MHPSRLYRKFHLLTGPPDSCRDRAARLAGADATWIGWRAPAPFDPQPPGRISGLLGQETDALVFDALEGFDPDAFAMAVGLVRGGGRFLLLTPPLEAWPGSPDREMERLAVAEWPSESHSPFLQRLASLVGQASWKEQAPEPLEPDESGMLTPDQQAAMELLWQVATGHPRRPLVITADRGRGKSTLLGMGAARLLEQRGGRILVTAPRRAAVEILFQQAEAAASQARKLSRGLAIGDGILEFMAPDALLAERPRADLLLVDEAAGIPLPLLEQLVKNHSRIALASTVHGYEGSGRGFELRFGRRLDELRPQWKKIRLEQPVRWAAGDPLEKLAFRALLLDAEPAGFEGNPPPVDACEVRAVTRLELLRDEPLLRQLFGLLTSAHYRTTPRDLRYLMDAPNLRLEGLFHEDRLLGAALIAREGCLSPALQAEILSGPRRPRGHLLPQLLATRCNLPEALGMRCERVVRIAIHPGLQGRGLGSRLLSGVIASARKLQVDLIGTSFGATPALVRFWRKAGLQPLRLGQRREASSGAHALVMALGLREASSKAVHRAAADFHSRFPCQLAEPFREIEAELALLLRQGNTPVPLPAADLEILEQFRRGRLPWLDALGALHRLSLGLDDADDPIHRLLVMKILQGRSWGAVADRHGLSGRKAVEQALREGVQKLLSRQSVAAEPTHREAGLA